jgi:hypothetical protein
LVLDEVRALESIRALLDWASSQTPRPEVIELVAQDEFTFDLIVEVRRGAYLVFDTS